MSAMFLYSSTFQEMILTGLRPGRKVLPQGRTPIRKHGEASQEGAKEDWHIMPVIIGWPFYHLGRAQPVR
ncbi:MAG: hypothetical protein DRH17_01835 [Deltaproteobacteria bacterium]|nr:MAG: hypothetical protein DRH17_01835 [Deltaproteobacteria bacterium]